MREYFHEESAQLQSYLQAMKGKKEKLEQELDRLITTIDEVTALISARRALEIMVTEICQTALKRDRGTEPLDRIIDKFRRENVVPEYIVASMKNLNRIGTFGAHPKDFTSGQVKEALVSLTNILEWYVTTRGFHIPADRPETLRHEPEVKARFVKEKAPPPLSAQDEQNRRIMLAKVRNFWVEGVLQESIQGAHLIDLDLEKQQGLVDHPWKMVMGVPDKEGEAVSPGTSIADVFEQSEYALLILGEPGSGKTTILLNLAREMLDQAEQNSTFPIPVVLNLSAWGQKHAVFTDWLAEELNLRYQIPRTIADQWIKNDALMLLLDGLDEVNPQLQEACVQAINQFRTDHGLVRMAVCSRLTDYQEISTQLQMNGAIIVKPLTVDQINRYLTVSSAEDQLKTSINKDDVVREMAATPLFLRIMTQTYQDTSLDDMSPEGTLSSEQFRTHLFNSYIDRAFTRSGRSRTERYSKIQTITWLKWLATKMKEHDTSMFLLDRMQPSWLLNWTHRWLYVLISRCMGSLLAIFSLLLFMILLSLDSGTIMSLHVGVISIFV